MLNPQHVIYCNKICLLVFNGLKKVSGYLTLLQQNDGVCVFEVLSQPRLGHSQDALWFWSLCLLGFGCHEYLLYKVLFLKPFKREVFCGRIFPKHLPWYRWLKKIMQGVQGESFCFVAVEPILNSEKLWSCGSQRIAIFCWILFLSKSNHGCQRNHQNMF